MARSRRVHICRECGAQHPTWTGRCGGCGAWATIGEAAVPEPRTARSAGRSGPTSPTSARPLAEVATDPALPLPVGIDEIDRVLGGGLTPGSVTLLAGEPGVGKSTLTLQMARSVAGSGATVVVVAGEEAPTQIAARAARIGPLPPSLLVIDDATVDAVVESMSERPQLVVVDSVQTVHDPELDSAQGSVAQVKAVAARLTAEAKRTGVSVVMVGHVTKDGAIAGPRALEHVVDTVLSFDGDRNGELRFLRSVKHRFGPTNEVGVFEMGHDGLQAVPDPSTRYLQDRRPGLAGSVVLPVLSGRRPVLIEVQALAVPTEGRPGQVTVQGVDSRRSALVGAVLTSRVGYRLSGHDLFLSAAGGTSAPEPAADLALAVAVASAIDGQPVAPDVVVCGEIGLGGELRSVPLIEQRLQEAYRLGFRTAVVPSSSPDGPTGLRVLGCDGLASALATVPHQVNH